jgi:hypothetical protein
MYLASPAADKSRILASIITGAIWTTALLAGVWFRRNWCRYALLLILLLSVASSMIFLPGLFEQPVNYAVLKILSVVTLVNGAAAWALACSRDIRRVTSRSHASQPYGYGIRDKKGGAFGALK